MLVSRPYPQRLQLCGFAMKPTVALWEASQMVLVPVIRLTTVWKTRAYAWAFGISWCCYLAIIYQVANYVQWVMTGSYYTLLLYLNRSPMLQEFVSWLYVQDTDTGMSQRAPSLTCLAPGLRRLAGWGLLLILPLVSTIFCTHTRTHRNVDTYVQIHECVSMQCCITSVR